MEDRPISEGAACDHAERSGRARVVPETAQPSMFVSAKKVLCSLDIFSKSGFTKGLHDLSNDGQVVLVNLQEIYEV